MAAKDRLREEMTQAVAQTWIMDAEMGLQALDHARRIFVVARKKS